MRDNYFQTDIFCPAISIDRMIRTDTSNPFEF